MRLEGHDGDRLIIAWNETLGAEDGEGHGGSSRKWGEEEGGVLPLSPRGGIRFVHRVLRLTALDHIGDRKADRRTPQCCGCAGRGIASSSYVPLFTIEFTIKMVNDAPFVAYRPYQKRASDAIGY